MKKPIVAIAILAMAFESGIAQAEFTCEQIQDKKTRAVCIADRVERASAAAGRHNELDDFVRTAKADLTKGYKDPASAEFTELVVSESDFRRSLCGKVNGKNSYGAYVGRKMFYVEYYKSEQMARYNPRMWTEGESAAESIAAKDMNSDSPSSRSAAMRLIDSYMNVAKEICEPSSTNTITKIDGS